MPPHGPLDGSGPGDLTKWMAVPWQTDTSSCLSGYKPIMGQYVPTFWPVRVPNDVLTEEDYRVVMDPHKTLAEKNRAFENRLKWLRGIVYKYGYPPTRVSPPTIGINEFITEWPQVGILIQKEGPGDANFPEKMWVENGRSVGLENVTALKSQAPETTSQPSQNFTDDGYLWMVGRASKRREQR